MVEASHLQQTLKALSDLQKVDLEIAALRKAADVFPKQIAELEKELAQIRSAVEAERARLADIDRQKRELEHNITQEKDKVKKWEARLAEQRSTREYAALAREIDIARKANITMAEELVELGKTQATTRETVKVREGELSARQDQVGGKIAELRTKMSESEGHVKALEGGRSEVAAKVQPQMLQRYDTVRKKRLPALAAIQNGTCSGCNRNIPPQQYILLRTSLGTDVCPSCNRIIYASEALEPPQGS